MEFEKLGAFYLGKRYDLDKEKLTDDLVMYDARDLTTHAVCVGMTGSGKTGLCLDLLEEAAIDHVPALIIDPKGDITNLLLTFPNLAPEDFRPWINVDDARRKGMSEDEYAKSQADLWREGLASWGQDGERIRMLRDSADFTIYTPGSDAGTPVSILQSFAAPALDWDDNAELLRERIQGTVSALLGLVGVAADPIRSREHILLSNLFEHFWRAGEDLDLPKIIMSIQNPPIRQLGVFDIDTMFPAKERFELAMMLNNIIAAPAFKSWLEGDPLDIGGFLATQQGKPRHSIFYIAHLSDAERMFFVTMLLNQLITWMRSQPGTTSLRALLYMDEVFGFFPPVAEPPSKKPMLTLMKQARAFGVGVMLTTQNPADLDYKGLTNAGTWFIGRLQTERDKARLLEGLESASAGNVLDRGKLDNILSSLGKRVFLLHNVHESEPVTFSTRWAMSYLRGPLTRSQVRSLMKDKPSSAPQATTVPVPQATVAAATGAAAAPAVTKATEVKPAPFATTPPALSDVQQAFLPLRKGGTQAEVELEKRAGTSIKVLRRNVLYLPSVMGMGRIHFVKQTKDLQVDEVESFALLAQPPEGVAMLRWEQAEPLDLETRDILDRPESESWFGEIPDSINESKDLASIKRELEDHLYRDRSQTIFYSPATKLYGEPGESERDFRMRATQAARELRDNDVDAIEDRYEDKLRTLEERLRTAKVALDKKEAAARTRKQDALISAGETVISLFSGRRRSVSAAARKVGNISTAKADVDAAEDKIEVITQDIEDLKNELKEATDAVVARWEKSLEELETIAVKPRRTDIEVNLFVLAWSPCWHITYEADGFTQTATIPAFT